jgi:hypothetical protein
LDKSLVQLLQDGTVAALVVHSGGRPAPVRAAAAMHEAKKGFRRLKAFLPALRAALAAHCEKETYNHAVAQKAEAA